MIRVARWVLPLLLLVPSGWAGRSDGQTLGQVVGGPLDAPIKLEVFSDFQCPSCRDMYLDTIRPVLRDYASKGKVCVIYHEYPLTMHKYAREAARYSAAAQRLGQMKWVPVVESLFMHQPEWSVDGNVEGAVAKALSAEDMQKVKRYFQDPGVNEAIDKEVALGQKREIKATPTLFLTYIGKEQRVEGGIPYTVLKQFLDQIVK
jgi:protein-disulfide isomerase